MYKSLYILVLITLLPLNGCSILGKESHDGWKLVWSDGFNGSQLDTTSWKKVQKGTSAWDNTMSNDPDLVKVRGGKLILKGREGQSIGDSTVYVSGGVYSQGLKAFKGAKFEIRAYFNDQQGFWPALWLMPDAPLTWSHRGGEIDIIEHVNFDTFVRQTAHDPYSIASEENRNNPINTGNWEFKVGKFNVYGVEVLDDRLVFSVNGKDTFIYPRLDSEPEGQFPFPGSSFFLILSNQIGGMNVGPTKIPVGGETYLIIDWVKVYQRQ